MMNGTLNVQSDLGQGSTFWIELEGSRDDLYSSKPHGSSSLSNKIDVDGSGEANSPKILIVEDNPSNLKLISSQLSALGYKADLASNGKEALKMTWTNDYALVITDCNMPIMDGYELTTEIRKSNNQVPVIALTADAFPEREQECLTAGMNDRIVKPISLQQLDNVLERWL
jgi:CheY-like chemotaxis protein